MNFELVLFWKVLVALRLIRSKDIFSPSPEFSPRLKKQTKQKQKQLCIPIEDTKELQVTTTTRTWENEGRHYRRMSTCHSSHTGVSKQSCRPMETLWPVLLKRFSSWQPVPLSMNYITSYIYTLGGSLQKVLKHSVLNKSNHFIPYNWF